MENELVAVEEEKEQKKEVQKKIIELSDQNTGKMSEEEFISILRSVAPGTNMRTALEGILKIGKGALILVENEFTDSLLDGGFKLSCRFSPQKLMELSKMDGAIVLSKDMKKIMYANVMLTPNSKIATNETGTRHRTAERAARMTGSLVIAISERKKEMHLYYKNIKYHLRESSDVSRRAFGTLQIIEKQKDLFDQALAKLNEMEMNNDTHIAQACKVIQKAESMRRLLGTIEKNLIELGTDASAMKAHIKEIMRGVEEEAGLVIKDYTKLNIKKTRNLLDSLSYDELIDHENIIAALAQKDIPELDRFRGWRILSKTNLTEQEISLILKEFQTLQGVLNAKKEDFFDKIGPEKADLFMRELQRVKREYNAATVQ